MILKYKCTENNELLVGTEKRLGQDWKGEKTFYELRKSEIIELCLYHK